jgi:deoxyribodipyrimidine photo-lyase
VEDKHNPYKSNNALQFMTESLIDLDKQILSSAKSDGNSSQSKLHIFYGEAENMVEQLIQNEHIDAVFSNRDYTPFSKSRDDIIKQVCEKYDVSFCQFSDYLLNEPKKRLKSININLAKVFCATIRSTALRTTCGWFLPTITSYNIRKI